MEPRHADKSVRPTGAKAAGEAPAPHELERHTG